MISGQPNVGPTIPKSGKPVNKEDEQLILEIMRRKGKAHGEALQAQMEVDLPPRQALVPCDENVLKFIEHRRQLESSQQRDPKASGHLSEEPFMMHEASRGGSDMQIVEENGSMAMDVEGAMRPQNQPNLQLMFYAGIVEALPQRDLLVW